MKKLNWLDKFAQEQYAKEQMKKQASTNKTANQIIVSPEDVPGAQNGAEVQFNGESFKVVDANFSDEIGPGVVLEKSAGASDGSYNGLEQDPMGLAMGAPASSVSTPSSQGQTYFRTKLDIQPTYDNDQDAQWGQSSAPATAQEIAGEDSTDRTNIPGHYTKSPGLNAPQDGAAGIGPVSPNAQVVGYPPVGPGQGSGQVQVQPGYQPQGAGMAAPVSGNGPVGGGADQVVDQNAQVIGYGQGTPSAAPGAPSLTPAAPVPGAAPTAPAAGAPANVPADDKAPIDDANADSDTGEEGSEEDNKILSALRKSMPKKAKVTRASLNNHIITLANDVADTITAEVEDVLEDAEEAVKAYVPARLASVALTKLEEALEEEGVEALFDKMVSKEALAKTASEDVSEDEIDQVVKKVAEVVIAELEGVLKDADEEMDNERCNLANSEDGFEMEAKLKAMVERKLHAKGIYTRFARTASAPAKKTIAQKIRDARRS